MNIMDVGPNLRISAHEKAQKDGVRPEHISIGAPGEGLCDGKVDVLEYLGADTFLIVDAGDLGQLTVRVIGDSEIEEGQEIGLMSAPENLHFFDESGLAI
jgi:multiple sugar transport system ATP-binding protein